MTRQSFIKGTMILLAAGIINRILGFIPRITLPRVIGAEGVGLYQLSWPFLAVILTLIVGGIPLAVAKLVAEAEYEKDESRVRTILIVSLSLTTGLGIAFTAICIAAAPWITSHLLTDSRVYYAFLSMSPMIVIIGISSVYRGYFQGRHNMIPTAASQVAETLMRIVTVILFAYLLLPYGLEYAAAGAWLGTLAGEICGLAVLLYHFRRSHSSLGAVREESGGRKSSAIVHLRRILHISVPVTGSKLVGSGSWLLESIMIAQSLAVAGVATAVATAQYGALQGMVIPILYMPTALTSSLAVSLVPTLSEAAARRDMKTIHKRLHQSLRLALVTGAPCVVVMYVLAEPLCRFLYNDTDVAAMLKMMAPVALFIYFQAPLAATLQSLDKPGTALLNTFTGSAIKLALIVLLATKPQFGIIGAIIAINANIVLVTLLHWNSVVRTLKFSMKLADFAKVGLAMVVMGAVSMYVMAQPWTDSQLIRFMAACLIGSFIYLCCVFWLKLVDKHDVVRIPWIGRLVK